MGKIFTKHLKSHDNKTASYKEPPEEKRIEMKQMLNDNTLIRIYTDCSSVPNNGIYGISSIFVGGGMTKIYNNKIYSRHVNQSLYGEYQAILFGLNNIRDYLSVLEKYNVNPQKFIIKTDIQYTTKHEHKHFQEVSNEIVQKIESLNEQYTLLEIEIKSMIKEEKKFNPYYTAAHNGSRKAIGKG